MASRATVKQLKELAKQRGLTGYSRLRKAELIAAIRADVESATVDESPSRSGPTAEMRFNARHESRPPMRAVDKEIMAIMGLLNTAIGAPKQEIWAVFTEVSNRFRDAINAM